MTNVDPEGLIVDLQGLQRNIELAGIKGRLLIDITPADSAEAEEVDPLLIPMEAMPTMQYAVGKYKGVDGLMILGYPSESPAFTREQLAEKLLLDSVMVLIDGAGFKELMNGTEQRLGNKLNEVQRATTASAKVTDDMLKTALIRARIINNVASDAETGQPFRKLWDKTVPTNKLIVSRRFGSPLIKVSRVWMSDESKF